MGRRFSLAILIEVSWIKGQEALKLRSMFVELTVLGN